MTDINRQMVEFVSAQLGWPIYDNTKDPIPPIDQLKFPLFIISPQNVKLYPKFDEFETWSPLTDHNHLAIVKRALRQKVGDFRIAYLVDWPGGDVECAWEDDDSPATYGKGDHAENDAICACVMQVMEKVKE